MNIEKRLESSFRKALYDYKMLEGVEQVSVALSGGKDSLTLLWLLHAISGKGFPQLKLHAIHVSGAFSCGAGVNTDYLQEFCKKLNVELHIRTSNQKLEDLECYSCSRTRRSLIFETAKTLNAPTIAFGHHQDDQAQTVLMNLFHKGEFAGNLPYLKMIHFGVTLIRPLIYIREEEIIEFAKQLGFFRILCKCPVGQNSMRKKTAHLLEEIETLFPHAKKNIARAGLLHGSEKAQLP